LLLHYANKYGTHGLACCKSAGRHFRDNAINDFIKRVLASAETQAILEPASFSRSDDKRPDGLTIVPLARGRSLCGTSLVPTRWLQATSTVLSWVRALWVATDAEQRKKSKYSSLSPLYDFTSIVVEMDFFRQLGRRIETTTAETSSLHF